MKFKKLITLSFATFLMMSISQSVFATKITVDKSGRTTYDTRNNGSGSSREQPVAVSCSSKCDIVIRH